MDNSSISGVQLIRTVTLSISCYNLVAISAQPRDSFGGWCAVKAQEPVRIVTDKLKSYSAAKRTLLPKVSRDMQQYANNRVEVSHQPTRMRERQMRRFKSSRQAQRFLSIHGVVQNLFRVGRHLLRSTNHRLLRARSFAVWRQVTAGWDLPSSRPSRRLRLNTC